MAKEKLNYPDLPQWMQDFKLSPQEWEGEKVYYGLIPTGSIERNDGQLEGVPSNPREWTRDDLDRLMTSIQEDPIMFLARGCIIYPLEGREACIAIGGNMRHNASEELDHQYVPSVIFPMGTDVATLKRVAAKDNGHAGQFDWDKLANEWTDLALGDMGINVWEMADQAQGESSSSSSSSDSPEKGSTTSQRLLLQFGGNKIQMSEAELEGLQSIFDRHVEKTGSSYGFVLKLIGGYFDGDENSEEDSYADSED